MKGTIQELRGGPWHCVLSDDSGHIVRAAVAALHVVPVEELMMMIKLNFCAPTI